MSAEPVNELLGRLDRGEVEAAEALFQAYSPYLRAIVRRQLSDRLQSKFDSSDVVQSVWVQVVRQLQKDGWQVGSEGQLKALLATIARRRLIGRVRKHTNGEEPQAALDGVVQERYSRPSEVAQADDVWDRMVRLCPPEHLDVLKLKRDGLPLADIAARTGLHEGSVRRILRRLARELALNDVPLGGAEGGDE